MPIGQQLTQVLQTGIPCGVSKKDAPKTLNASFYRDSNGKAVNQGTIGGTFRSIREKAGVRRTDGARYQPRLHDLRHTFAVHRLTEWYKEGSDVQRLLPVLSFYLGHTSVGSDFNLSHYDAALLEEAGRRFEQYAFRFP